MPSRYSRTDGGVGVDGGKADGGRGGDDETRMVSVLIFGFFWVGLQFLVFMASFIKGIRLLSRLASVSFIVWVCAKIVGPSARLMTEVMSLRTALVSSEEWSQRWR